MKPDTQQFTLRGAETAQRLREGLAEQRLVERFVDSYAAQHDRTGLKASPLRYRELLITIQRESLLALAAKIETLLPKAVTRRATGVLRPAESDAIDAFREAFLDALGSALQWMPSDREEFTRDLILYGHISARHPRARPPGRAAAVPEGAFVDRCALLLDPSLLDMARAAAGKLLLDLESLAEGTFDQVFGGRPPRKSKKRRR